MPLTLSRAAAHDVAMDQPPRIDDYGVIGDRPLRRRPWFHGQDQSIGFAGRDMTVLPFLRRSLAKSWAGGGPFSGTAVFSRRSYHGDSNVLETEFVLPDGRATLTDLMPVASEEFKRENLVPDHELLRQIVCTEGEFEIEVDFVPRAFYGCRPVRIRDAGSDGLRMAFSARCILAAQQYSFAHRARSGPALRQESS